MNRLTRKLQCVNIDSTIMEEQEEEEEEVEEKIGDCEEAMEVVVSETSTEAAGDLASAVAMDESMTPILLDSVPQVVPQATVPCVPENITSSTNSRTSPTITAGGKRMLHQLLVVLRYCSSFSLISLVV